MDFHFLDAAHSLFSSFTSLLPVSLPRLSFLFPSLLFFLSLQTFSLPFTDNSCRYLLEHFSTTSSLVLEILYFHPPLSALFSLPLFPYSRDCVTLVFCLRLFQDSNPGLDSHLHISTKQKKGGDICFVLFWLKMRYENWDVLLFPEISKVPIQEYRTQCTVTKGRGTLYSSLKSTSPLCCCVQWTDT